MYNKAQYLHKDSNYYQHERHEMIKYIPTNAKNILEIGCGDGSFGAMIKENIQCRYWGIEPDSRFINSAKEHLDFFDNAVFTTDYDLPLQHFDCIVFNDVLEHFVEPEKILLYVKSFLKDNGVIVSSIPNLRHAPYLYRLFYLGEFEYQDAGIMDRTHLRFFTKKSIISLYKNAGYKIILHEGINKSISEKFSLALRFLKIFTNKFEDTEYQQFATVVKIQ
ncbi:class I SAM-dependent methyltransferase [Pedobacter rhodius]|uniref:Class I SAM-dependent methyltransferase n=1 Tax=Pedobacter rhodius TaxID=3004098 RepID=A0ABT4KVC0_9SPHI|nr:class I SAM-dependent methyltransferase [Pedobacter sp. SJ11]MCZ4221803.1 class I SAM-dependent methyltransferase [Pedobacter sp. SJ11]